MDINFLQYQPGPLAPITIKGCPVHQVQTYKLLEVHVSCDLSWNTHVEHIVTKAQGRSQGGFWGARDPPFCKLCSSETCHFKPKHSLEADMTIW